MRPFRFLVIAALAVVALPAVARDQDRFRDHVASGDAVYVFRTQETPTVETNCLAGQNIVLGAYVYAPRTRAVDGKVVRELGEPVGTVVGCGTMTSVALGATATFTMDFDLEGRKIFAAGKCEVTQRIFTAASPYPVLMVGCSLAVEPSADEPTLTGIATSASIFNSFKVPGYETGSYWTLHLVKP